MCDVMSEATFDRSGVVMLGLVVQLISVDCVVEPPHPFRALSAVEVGCVSSVSEGLNHARGRSRYDGVLCDARRHRCVCLALLGVHDRGSVRHRLPHLIGIDKLMWEQDVPHSDSNLPSSPKYLKDFGRRAGTRPTGSPS